MEQANYHPDFNCRFWNCTKSTWHQACGL